MEIAVDEMRKCEGRGPRVGVVIEREGKIISIGHRSPGLHAERAAVQEALSRGIDLRGATLYSTLEPCVEVGAPNECCADLIARVGVRTVYIGRYDPNPLIYRGGWKRLRELMASDSGVATIFAYGTWGGGTLTLNYAADSSGNGGA